MQTTSALYKQILADPEHVKEWRAQIGDLTFDKTNTVSVRRSSALYGKQLIGGACSGSLELGILQSTAHWWRKSKVLYAEFNEEQTDYVDEDEVESGITLYKRVRAEDDYPFSNRITPYDGITVSISEVNDAIERGYIYHGSVNFVTKWSSVHYYEDEELWMHDFNSLLRAVEMPEEGDVPIEGDFLEEISAASADAYPTYGQSGGFWYSYDGERAATIPEMARIELSVRLVSDFGTSEYLPMGTYWINRRKDDQEDGTLELECVDGMMFGEQDFYPAGSTITYWTNKTMREVAQLCATKMGIALEDATQFQNAAPYILTAPPIGYSVRQVLAGIAAAHGGNIIVTTENKLRLVPFVPTDSGIDLGQNAASLETGKQYEAFGNVVFNFDSASGEKLIVRYPTTEASGATMEAPLQTVTDSGYAAAIAQNVLSALGSYQYAPYKAADALLDPAMELGDGITINGLYSVIAEADDICDELYSADIGAESFEEVKNEFIFRPSAERTIDRKIAQTSASFRIDIDRIASEVSGKITTFRQATVPTALSTGDLWYCTADISGATSYKEKTWYRWSGSAWVESSEEFYIPVAPAWRIYKYYYVGDAVDYDGVWYTALQVHQSNENNKPPNADYWEVQTTISSVVGSKIEQTNSKIEAIVQNIGIGGAVTAASIIAAINGDTSEIKINADKITLTGYVSFNDLLEEDGTVINGSNIMTGTIAAERIETSGLRVQNLEGNRIWIFDEYGAACGYIVPTDTMTGIGIELRSTSGGFRITSAGNFFAQGFGQNGAYLAAGDDLITLGRGDVIPSATGSQSMGSASFKWSAVYATTGTIQTSDREQKEAINYDVSGMDGFFDDLMPVSFKFKDGTSNRTHFGLISQDVESNLTAHGMVGTDFAGFCKDVDEEGHALYSLRYDEFIALCIDQIQKLKARVKDLETAS